MRRTVLVMLLLSCMLAHASSSDGIRPDMQTLIETKWEGISAFELVRRIHDDFIKLQPEVAQQQWQTWRDTIKRFPDGLKQRDLLIKSGLLESTTGECKIALQEIVLLLQPTLNMAKRFDRAMKREKHVQLDAWKPIYELISKEDYKTANDKLEEFKLDEEHSSALIKAFFGRLKVVMKEELARKPLESEPEKKSDPHASEKTTEPAPTPAPAPEKKD